MQAGLFALAVTWFVSHAAASELDDRRVRISLEIFPRIVAVDQDIRDKLTADDKVRLYVIYEREAVVAQRIVEDMRRGFGNIGGREVEFVVRAADEVAAAGLERPAAVFLAEPMREAAFRDVAKRAQELHVLVFSPFAGDVERGATVGIAISSRIKPYFNVPVLHSSRIHINEKLLDISQRYE
jgi:hypothetical protein